MDDDRDISNLTESGMVIFGSIKTGGSHVSFSPWTPSPGDIVRHRSDGWEEEVREVCLPPNFDEPIALFKRGGFWRVSQLDLVRSAP